MTFTVTHVDGSMDDGEDADLDAIFVELDTYADVEHPDVAISDDDTGWSLSAFSSGLVVLENPEARSNQPQHMRLPTRAEVRELFAVLARGDVDSVLNREWNPGYGSR
jgi:hypothetical protein